MAGNYGTKIARVDVLIGGVDQAKSQIEELGSRFKELGKTVEAAKKRMEESATVSEYKENEKIYKNLLKEQKQVEKLLKRNQSIPLLRHLSHELIYLASVHKELSGAKRILIEYISLLIGIYVHSPDIEFSLISLYEGFLYGAMSLPYGFYLSAVQLYSRLIFLIYKIIVICLFIVRYQAYTVLSHLPPP